MEIDLQSRLVAQGASHYTEPTNLAMRQIDSELERFGGLKGRYQNGNFKEVRSQDPFAFKVIRFPRRVHMENWLLRLFTPGLSGHYVPTERLMALQQGRYIGAKPSLVMMLPGGKLLADFVAPESQRESIKWAQFKTAATAHGYTPVFRSESEIRSQPMLLRNLENLRFQLGLHAAHREQAYTLIPLVRPLVLSAGGTRVGDVHDRLRNSHTSVEPEAIDTALTLMLLRGEITINLTEADYGVETRIQLL